MTPEKEIVCVNCKYYNIGVNCPAFGKNGIPSEILSGENDHKKPLDGQENEIVFEEVKDK